MISSAGVQHDGVRERGLSQCHGVPRCGREHCHHQRPRGARWLLGHRGLQRPTLLVCLNRSSSAYASVIENGVVCVNVLSSRHEHLSRLFGGKVPADIRFAAATWSTLATGAPVLADGTAAFDCRITEIVNVGTHDVLLCRVVALRGSDCADNLIYFGRGYHVVSGRQLRA